MARINDINEIKKFWDREALRLAESKTGTHSDPYLVELENWFIIEKCFKRFSPRNMLDVGCGNGQRTKLFSKYVGQEVIGIDYSENMIKLAKKLEDSKTQFQVANIIDDLHLNRTFDCVVSCRALINLGSLENQIKAIDKIHSLLSDGGLFVFCEGSMQGTEQLNNLRSRFGLEAVKPIPVNLDLNEVAIMKHIEGKFDVIEKTRFGVYYLLTRAYYPALIFPDEPDPKSKFNEIAARLTMETSKDISCELYGRHLCVVAKKRI